MCLIGWYQNAPKKRRIDVVYIFIYRTSALQSLIEDLHALFKCFFFFSGWVCRMPGCRGHLFSALRQSSEDLCRQIEREGLLGNVYITCLYRTLNVKLRKGFVRCDFSVPLSLSLSVLLKYTPEAKGNSV